MKQGHKVKEYFYEITRYGILNDPSQKIHAIKNLIRGFAEEFPDMKVGDFLKYAQEGIDEARGIQFASTGSGDAVEA